MFLLIVPMAQAIRAGSGGFSPALTCRCPSLLQTHGDWLPYPSAWSPNAVDTGAACSHETSHWGRAGAMDCPGAGTGNSCGDDKHLPTLAQFRPVGSAGRDSGPSSVPRAITGMLV